MRTSFIHFFGEVYNKKDSEIGVESPRTAPIDIYVDPNQVVAVREYLDGDEMKPNGSVIYLKSGEDFWVEDSTSVALDRLEIYAARHEGTVTK